MSQRTVAADPYKRHKTRHRGISYRVRADGSRSYSVYWQGKYVPGGGTEREALAKQAELRGKAARGERVIIAAKIELGTAAEDWYEDAKRRLRPGTARDYRSYLDRIILPRLGTRMIGSIGPQDIVELTRDLEARGLSRSTVANTLKPLSGTLAYAVFRGLVPTNPMTQVPSGYKPSCNTTREHREWTTEEVERLIRVGYERDGRPEARGEYGLAIELKLRTGTRLGELLGTQYGDIETEELSSGKRVAVLHIRRQWTKDGRVDEPKTPKARRRVPLSPALSAKLAARKLRFGATDDEFIFAPSRGGNPPTHSNFRRRGWNEAVKAACLTEGPRVTPHDARHAFASMMAEHGLTSSDVAEVMGHTTAGVTERIYTHAFNREAREERVRNAMAAAMGGARLRSVVRA